MTVEDITVTLALRRACQRPTINKKITQSNDIIIRLQSTLYPLPNNSNSCVVAELRDFYVVRIMSGPIVRFSYKLTLFVYRIMTALCILRIKIL